MKLLYLLHTDWNWIKQRSQFLAEELDNNGCEVTVAYKFSFKRQGLVKNKTSVRLFPLPLLPFKLRVLTALAWIDRIIWRSVIKVLTDVHSFDKIIVTHPLLVDYVAGLNIEVIYDCHDDNAEFYPDGDLRNLIVKKHQDTLRIASRTIFSSNHLLTKFGDNKNDSVIRNGHRLSNKNLIYAPNTARLAKSADYNVVYFGTVSEWFDFDALIHVVESIPNVNFTIIGPSDIPKKVHPRFIFKGAMDHDDLMAEARYADAFIMPFRINELILGVDPVKIYEYLSFPVPTISVYYPELIHFSPHLHFYSTAKDLTDLLRELTSTRVKIDVAARTHFIHQSSWYERAIQFKEAIEQ